MMKKGFVAFVVTFERPSILCDTIEKIFKQSIAPEKLLVVDNSESDFTASMIHGLNASNIEYYRVGYNAGPAGGVYLGLKLLTDQGYDYIQWCDDDDPPIFNDTNEILLAAFDAYENVGVVGQVGAQFNKVTGALIRFDDSSLKMNQYLDVDFVGGNQLMIIKSEVIKQGCLPEKRLFFGFEDLSFSLKVKAKGYKMLVPCKLFLKLRVNFSRMGQVKLKRNPSWRDYYSVRSLAYIYLYEQRLVAPLLLLTIKTIAGLFLRKELKFLPLRGLVHGVSNRLGIIEPPRSKYDIERI